MIPIANILLEPISTHLGKNMEGSHKYKLPRSEITYRQVEILNFARDGCNNREIGQFLGIKESTVKNQMREIMIRLDAADRTSAVVKAIKIGYLSLGLDRETAKQLDDLKAMREASRIRG